ncbi:unnamed protein product [Gordionus sp. m RMFG-2023]
MYESILFVLLCLLALSKSGGIYSNDKDEELIDDLAHHLHFSHPYGYELYENPLFDISHDELYAFRDLSPDQKSSHKKGQEPFNIIKNVKQQIKDSILEVKQKIITKVNLTKSKEKQVNFHHIFKLEASKKILHSSDTNKISKEFNSAKKIIEKNFIAKIYLKNLTKNIEFAKKELIKTKIQLKKEKELIKAKKSIQRTNNIFLPTSFLSNIDFMRIPFLGASLKLFAEMKLGLKPEFCGKHSCPPFKVVCKNSLYEVRQYDKLTLATMTVDGSDYLKTGLKSGIIEIFKYLNGNNNRNVTIPFSVPVVVKSPPSASTYPRTRLLEIKNVGAGPSISLSLTPPFDVNPPIPTCPSLKIKYVTNGICYVRMFGDYTLPSNLVSKENEFVKILQNNNQFITHRPMAAFYNKPNKFANQHYEIFIPVSNPVQGDRYC